MLHSFRSTKDNPVWDYFLSLSHTQTSFIAYRKDENNNQQYVGLIYRLIRGYGASAVPPSCFGGCIHKSNKDCPTELKLFDAAADGIEWVMTKAGRKGPMPTDLVEPDSMAMHDKNQKSTNGFWDGRYIYFSTPVADQKKVEPAYAGKELNVRQAPKPKAKPTFEPYRPASRDAWMGKKKESPKAKPPVKQERVAIPVAEVRKDVSIEEHLEAAIKDVQEAFNTDTS